MGVWKQFRIKYDDGQRKVFINPTPTTTACEYECRDGTKTRVGLVYEYISKYWGKNAAGEYIKTFSLDTDTILLPEDIVEAELKWRWLRSLGRDYADERIEAEELIETTLGQDGEQSVLTAHGSRDLDYPNIPETGIGLS